MPSMLSEQKARAFAESWYAAWNARDLDRIMSHYSAGIEHSSPFIARYNNSAEPTLRGREEVRAYFGRALERNPTLAFHPKRMALGTETVVLMYERMNGDFAAEMFVLAPSGHPEEGKILKSVSHYALG